MGQTARKLVYHPTHKGAALKARRRSGSVLAAVRYAELLRARLELGTQFEGLHPFNKLLSLHTGRLWGIDGLEEFFEYLKAEPVRREFFMELLLELSKPKKIFGRSETSGLVSEFLRWYVERAASIEKFGESLGSSNLEFADLKVSHDIHWAGSLGLSASFSLALRGYAGTTAWAALSLEQNGRPVYCRSGWESWCLHIGPRVPLDQHDRPVALGLFPLPIAEQHKIIDRAEVFLPYAALDISIDCVPTTAVLQILSASGQVVKEERVATQLGGLYRDRPITSPQARSIWHCDYESGSAFERGQIIVSGKRYENLSLSVQSLDSEDQGEVIFEQQISPDYSVQRVSMPEVEPPSSAEFLEYSLKSSDAQILCGSLVAVRAQASRKV